MTRKLKLTWLVFLASIIAAWLFAERAWTLAWYQEGKIALLLVTIGAALIVLATAQRKAGTVVVVVACLVLGNWGVLEGAAMQLFWSAGGFAP